MAPLAYEHNHSPIDELQNVGFEREERERERFDGNL